jgi:hypothetical protein
MRRENILFALLLAVLFVSAFLLFPQGGKRSTAAGENAISHSEERFQQAIAAELDDKCLAPKGYSQEAWETHMSHHPDRYTECLG